MKYIVIISLFVGIPLFAGQISTILNENKKLDKLKITEYIKWASPHIKQYPPRFKDKEQQKKIYLSTLLIAKEIKNLSLKNIKDVNTLIDCGYILSMGHNLDLGTSELSKQYFEKAIKIEPDNVKANYLLGMFLVSTRKYFYDSVPYLEKARKLGEKDAGYTLALIYIRKKEIEKGMKMLEEYSKNNPKNEYVKRMIKAIKDKELKFKEK